MIGALWTGISGLSSQQQALDNESNNIANVNTIGFKASRISFADQMYQDRIGKGSKILDAEKLYTQGGLKLTGVNYDMALSGDGFFTVINNRNSGTSETLYTRAGNFRMGDNGTLQDAAGNEVQGWPMTTIDSQNDVTSTNPNVNIFNSDYTNLLSSKIIKHDNYVETITAKSTDYKSTAKSDSSTIFSGAGMKTKSSKESDIEAAIKDYTNWLKKLQDEPDGVSAASIPQVTEINFKTGSNGIISKDSDQIYVYINGNKYSQNYVETSSTQAFRTELWNGLTAAQRTSSGLVDPGTVAVPISLSATQLAAYDKEASRIATYKGLSDKISEIPGLVAYMASETSISSGNNDVLEMTDTFSASTKIADMYKGIIQIKSLIPGTEFTVSEVAEVSSNTTNQGNFLTTTTAQAGSGIGALETSKDALSKLITGKQQDVYTVADLGGSFPATFTYSINIYDKELGKTIPVPNDNATIPTEDPITITSATDIDDFITKFNTAAAAKNPKLTDYVEAVNINGNLVIRTKDKNYDVEFSGGLKLGTLPKDKNADYSGRAGAGAEFIEIKNRVDQTASKSSLQLRLDTLGISDTAFGEFSVDSSGLITMKQDGADFAIGQVAIALFNNNQGLDPMGDNLLAKTNESGEPIYNLNNNKTAKIEGKTLELSTADLSESLVNLMVFQRAFEANAKSITTSDDILNTLINLKR